MTGKERISRILRRQPVDRIGIYEHFWQDTYAEYAAKGKIPQGESYDDHFNFDMSLMWAFNMVIDLDFENEIVSETEDTVLIKDGNGAFLRRHKHHDTTPEHVDFTIKTQEDWDKVKHLLQEPDERRINFEGYREAKANAEKAGRFFAWSGVNPFECMQIACGHENLLIGMALEPEWVIEMSQTYATLTVKLLEKLFEKEGYPDGLFIYEDLGFKEKPFLSPDMYKEILFPSHKYVNDYAHSKNLPVIVHSCGFVEPLLPAMIESGIDCLQAIEVKAGMDLLHLHRTYGDKIVLMGGIDVRALYSNDMKQVDAELEAKIPTVMQGYGYIAHSDHSIPKTVDYETLRYYIDKVLELGTYGNIKK